MTIPTVPFEEYVGWQDTWIKRVIEFDSHNLRSIPTDDSVILSNNGISHVILHRPTATIYKRSIQYLVENEIYWLNRMKEFAKGAERQPWLSYVPGNIQRLDKYTISMEYLGESQPVNDETKFIRHWKRIGIMLIYIQIRHGDLTPPNIIVRDDIPHVLDWAESRFMDDPRPDKREGSNEFWLRQTFAELCK